MLIQLIQLLEDDSYEYSENYIQSEAYANVHAIESVEPDEENENRCHVYLMSGNVFYVDESAQSFKERHDAMLYGAHLTKFYKLDRLN